MTGFPAPVVTWRKAQGSLAKDRIFQDGGLLTLVLTEKHDIGSYICHTKNYLGETSAATSLVVLSVPKFITRPPASVSRIAGSGLSLNCSAIGDPTPTVSWKRSEGAWGEERMNVSGGTLRISGLSEDDSGIYICEAKMPNYTIQARTELTVKG